MRIVLVEDNDELAEAIIDRFRGEGHAIDREADGEQASELAGEDRQAKQAIFSTCRVSANVNQLWDKVKIDMRTFPILKT